MNKYLECLKHYKEGFFKPEILVKIVGGTIEYELITEKVYTRSICLAEDFLEKPLENTSFLDITIECLYGELLIYEK